MLFIPCTHRAECCNISLNLSTPSNKRSSAERALRVFEGAGSRGVFEGAGSRKVFEGAGFRGVFEGAGSIGCSK